MMDHVHIARVYDAGTTDTGIPYFVMEPVRGVPITQYCDSRRLTVEQRIERLIPACQAIQHAHQKGIIHRDIKPSNILVSERDGVYRATGDYAKAEPLYVAALSAYRLFREALPVYERVRYDCQNLLGARLSGQNRIVEVEPLLLAGLEGVLQRRVAMDAEDRPRVTLAGNCILEFYQGTGRPQKVAKWKQRHAILPSSDLQNPDAAIESYRARNRPPSHP